MGAISDPAEDSSCSAELAFSWERVTKRWSVLKGCRFCGEGQGGSAVSRVGLYRATLPNGHE
jgi:hypothetical protein